MTCATVNVDIFVCMNFREFAKIGNLVRIYFSAFEIIVYIWHNKGYFHDILFLRIFRNHE